MEGHSILCYNHSMSSILIVGKDLPDGLEIAEAFASSGRSVFGVAKSEADVNSFESENIYASTWNKSSAVSAHSLIIKAETKLDKIEEVLFYPRLDHGYGGSCLVEHRRHAPALECN